MKCFLLKENISIDNFFLLSFNKSFQNSLFSFQFRVKTNVKIREFPAKWKIWFLHSSSIAYFKLSKSEAINAIKESTAL